MTDRIFRAWPLLLALCCWSCGDPAAEDPPPNVVLVTLDTTRADHLGYHGYWRETSPFLDSLAKESIVFERCIVPMATTLPTHTSILTGTSPLEHGVTANADQGGRRFQPAPGLRSFAELAREAGYATGAFVSATPLKRDSGIAAGFDVFEQPEQAFHHGGITTQTALDWLKTVRERPYFLWVHYYDAHWPPSSPPAYRQRFETDAKLEARLAERRVPERLVRNIVNLEEETRQTINLYDADLRFQDDLLRHLFKTLRERADWANTAVVVIGDHGDGLGQHGELAHGGTWNEQLHAPFLLYVPGEAPRRVDELVSATDALPTLLGRLPLPGFETFLAQSSGRDALASDYGSPAIMSLDTTRATRDTDYRRALTTERWKYYSIERRDGSKGEELYDLSADPHELEDVLARFSEVAAKLRERTEAILTAESARGEALRAGEIVPVESELTPEQRRIMEELESLGYTGEVESENG